MTRPSYFFSDVHIAAPDGPRTESFIDQLRHLRGHAEAVYFVGDLFDFWLGYRSTIYSAFFPVLRAIAELVEGGTRVVYLAGNHDPDPGSFLQSLGVEVHEGPIDIDLNGRRVHLEHGDVIDPRGLGGRLLCRTVRHPWIRACVRLVHPGLLWRLSRWYARHGETYTDPLPTALRDEWFPSQVRRGMDAVIIGHYHRAVVHHAEVDGRQASFFALGDWVGQRTYLRFDGEFTLLRSRGADAEPVALPPGDHAPEGR